jgi:hypothetical protein
MKPGEDGEMDSDISIRRQRLFLPLDGAPVWHEESGRIVSSAIADVGYSDLDPGYPHEIYLEVEDRRLDDHDDDALPFLWRYGLARQREDEGLAIGWAASLEDAQRECWQMVIAFWRNEGFTDEQIAQSVCP